MPRGEKVFCDVALRGRGAQGFSYEDDKLGSGEEDHCTGGSRASLVSPRRFEAEDVDNAVEFRIGTQAPVFFFLSQVTLGT